MPDHVHQLVHGRTPTADTRKFVRLAKQYSGFYYAKAFQDRLWQRYGRDDVSREDDDIKPIARYIVDNPVKAGLVARAQDYPFTGSHIYTIEELVEWAYS